MCLGPYFLGLTEFTAVRPILSFRLTAQWPFKNDAPLVKFWCPQISKEKEMRSRRCLTRLSKMKCIKQLGGRLRVFPLWSVSFSYLGVFCFVLFFNHCLFNWMEMFTSAAFIIWSGVSKELGYRDHSTNTSFSSHQVHFANISWAIGTRMRAF